MLNAAATLLVLLLDACKNLTISPLSYSQNSSSFPQYPLSILERAGPEGAGRCLVSVIVECSLCYWDILTDNAAFFFE